MPDLTSAFISAMAPYEREPRNVNEIAETLDLPARQRNPELAIRLSDTTDKRSREYRNALRRIQRYRKGTYKPSATVMDRLTRAGNRILTAQAEAMRTEGCQATISGSMFIYNRRRTLRMPASGYQRIVNFAHVIEAWEAREDSRAADYFLGAFLVAYGMGGVKDVHPEDITIEILPA